MKMSAQNKGFTTFMKTERGFTLVELMVVISIIAILSMIGLTMYSSAQKSSRDGKRRADIQAIQTALEQYRTDHGAYPAGGWDCSAAGTTWIPGLSGYFSNGIMPVDPINTTYADGCAPGGYAKYNYMYYAADHGAADGAWYMLVVELESPTSTETQTYCTDPNGVVWPYGAGDGHSRMVCNQQ